VSPRTETASKANGPGTVAPHTEAPGSGSGVKAEVVPLPFAFLSGEPSIPGAPNAGSGATGNRRVEGGGVSRGHRSALARAPRPKPAGCDATPEPRPATKTPQGRVEGLEDSAGKHGGAQAELLEQILSRDNRLLAWQRVQAHQGAAGRDGMTIQAFPEFARQHWERIRSALEAGTYRPAAVLRVMLPKASGGERPLGIPTVLDRGIQQAIAQVIGPLFEPHFRTYSYGFRPGRRARMALAEMEEAHRAGLRSSADCDLKRCFDTVNHGLVLNRLAKRSRDRRVVRLSGRYLRAGVILPDGRREPTSCGVPQGGPLSPWLANGRPDDLDKELERRGRRLARYADDLLSCVRSQRAAKRVLPSLSRFIEGHWRLRVNPNKSKAARLSACSCLGFELRRAKWHWTDAAVKRCKERVREITNRSNGRKMTSRLEALKRYVSGWLNYFGHSQSYAEVVEWDQWLRRRVRLCYWKQWQRPRTRRRPLLALGRTRDAGKLATRSRKGPWRMAGNSIVQRARNKQWLWKQGVPNLRQQWLDLHYGASAP
jgi:RNA-directed DNA polymerase